jgi:hypothetical protein
MAMTREQQTFITLFVVPHAAWLYMHLSAARTFVAQLSSANALNIK